ncbi:EI24 domain-containing protein [Luteolibacter flavescens]|uniref:EI24 domain-containing protein n=1 Tax=Luteolibacter flavescens TaxID=1859460 RepID=A0ABT3FPF0_9BACT|nr:EI24 domain-containing protein [Luteolibacter flavescens]MCW1884860.1 EI24 domain-containing protein [Luteolibacter flavescens]
MELPPPGPTRAPALGFGHGVRAVPQALGIIRRRPGVLLWMVPPFLITLLLDVLVFWFAFGWMQERIGGWLPSWAQAGWVITGAQAFAAIGLLFVLGWTFAWSFLLLSSPFQDYISAAVEKDRGNYVPDPEGIRGFLKSTSLGAFQALVLMVLTLPVMLLGIIPVFGTIIVFAWSAFVMGFSFFTIPAGRTARRLSDRVALVRQHLPAMLGLGALVAAAALVPLLNVLCLPVFIVAGTLLYLEGEGVVPEDRPTPDGEANADG